jgi:hypothetical protein
MNIDIRLPNITAKDEAGQIQQMRSYLHQLAEQLNWALNAVETAQSGTVTPSVVIDKRVSPEEAESTFNSIKALIIKSADIVKAYEDTIFTDFNGKYFADSDFGTYIEETSRKVDENSKGVNETYTNIQTISNTVDGLAEESRTTNAYIKRGLLDYDENGKAIYGVEVGETNENGAFLRYARFKADRLSFYDENSAEVAYIGAGCLFVLGKTVFLGEIQLGSYKTDTSDGLAFTWIGG